MKPISEIEYLAIPYTDDDEAVMDFRAAVSDIICADLMNQGRYIYAPISSCHHIAKKYGLPRTWEYWKGMDEAYVSICKTFIVIMLSGWETSTGVTAELEIAKRCGARLEYIDPTPYIKQLEEKSESYSKQWVKADLMVNTQTNEIHAVGGDREPGEGDTPYIGYEVIKRLIKRENK